MFGQVSRWQGNNCVWFAKIDVRPAECRDGYLTDELKRKEGIPRAGQTELGTDIFPPPDLVFKLFKKWENVAGV